MKRCRDCGTTKGEFGVASGLCMRCSDATVESLIAECTKVLARRVSVRTVRRTIAARLDARKGAK